MREYPLRNAALDLLLRIDGSGGYSHLLIDNEIKSRKIAEKDEGLLTEIVYGTMERKMTLDYYLEPFVQSKKLDAWVRMLLRMSLYQMIYLDKVPDYAIFHEAVEIAKARGHKGIASVVNGVLRSIQRKGVRDTNKITNNVKRLAIETSHPEWLVERWINAYGYDVTKEMCEANLTYQQMSVRVQPLKISREKAMEILKEQGYKLKPSQLSDQGIVIEEGNILQSNLFQDGYLTIQDQSSMLVAEMLDARQGMYVLDACSAPGGKVTHIAEKMEDKGVIYAYDLHKKKIDLINDKARKLDLTIIDANDGDARKLHTVHEPESFDRIVVDAPCTGLGVIRSKPDVKYNKKEEDIYRLATIQLDILNNVAPLLKENGLLIYSTCTVDVEENENIVRKFLVENKDYQLDPTFVESLPEGIKQKNIQFDYGLQLFPQTFQTDGFFLTRFIKRTTSQQ